MTFNSFHGTGIFLCPLKTSERLWFFMYFKEYRKKLVARNKLWQQSVDIHASSIVEHAFL